MRKFGLLLVFVLLSCKNNEALSDNKTVAELESSDKIDLKSEFPDINATCTGKENLFNAIPHLDSYDEYNFVKVACVGTNILAEYNHPKEKLFNIKICLYQEKEKNKIFFNTAKATYENLKQFKNKNNEISDLKILDNAYINFKKDLKYDKITYSATFKKDYTFIINVKGKNLSSKELADGFLYEYLKNINLSALN